MLSLPFAARLIQSRSARLNGISSRSIAKKYCRKNSPSVVNNDLKLPRVEQRRNNDGVAARKSKDILFSDSLEDIAELQWRLAPAFAAIVLGLLAIPLSHSAPREGRGGRTILGILAYTVYVNMVYMSRGWVASGDLSPVLGIWWVHVVVLVTALLWLRRQGRMVGKG